MSIYWYCCSWRTGNSRVISMQWRMFFHRWKLGLSSKNQAYKWFDKIFNAGARLEPIILITLIFCIQLSNSVKWLKWSNRLNFQCILPSSLACSPSFLHLSLFLYHIYFIMLIASNSVPIWPFFVIKSWFGFCKALNSSVRL